MSSEQSIYKKKYFNPVVSRYFYLVLFIPLITIYMVTFHDYGITWDESVQSRYGELVIKYFQSGFQDNRCNNYLNLQLYGPLFEVICTGINKVVDLGKFEVRHLLIGICSLLTVFSTYKIGQLFNCKSFVPFYSAVVLIMIPRFYGHSFNNSKDIPFTFVFSLAMYLSISLILRNHQKPWKPFIYCGLVIGIALSIRIGAVLLIFYTVLGIIIAYIMDFKISGKKIPINALPKLAIRLSTLCFFSWLVMVISWPWMHENPIYHPIKAFWDVANFSPTYEILFEGNLVYTDNLPVYYLIKYLSITMPPVFLILFVIGLLTIWRRMFMNNDYNEKLFNIMIQIWFFFPILFVTFMGSKIYDGIRHLLFILPAFALICGFGATQFHYYLNRWLKKTTISTIIVLLICLIPVKDLISLHPYQMTFFNIFVGGLARASNFYETDYWLSSYKEAAEWLNKKVEKEELTILLAANYSSRVCLEYYLHPEIKVHTLFIGDEPIPSQFDYYLATSRYWFHRYFPQLPVDHIIGRKGAVFCVIKRGLKRL